jgi:hypothetical protein
MYCIHGRPTVRTVCMYEGPTLHTVCILVYTKDPLFTQSVYTKDPLFIQSVYTDDPLFIQSVIRIVYTDDPLLNDSLFVGVIASVGARKQASYPCCSSAVRGSVSGSRLKTSNWQHRLQHVTMEFSYLMKVNDAFAFEAGFAKNPAWLAAAVVVVVVWPSIVVVFLVS